MDYFRVVYTLESRVHSVLVPLIRLPEPGETITIDHGRKAVVRAIETDADRSDGLTLHVDLTGF